MIDLTEKQQEIRQNILVWTEKGRSAVISIDKGKRDNLFNDEKIKSVVDDFNDDRLPNR